MSLLTDLQDFTKNLGDIYKRKDMSDIVDKYCQHIATLPQKEVAKYVVPADRFRFETQKDDLGNPMEYILNSGHVFTGLMNDKECFEKFIAWYNEKYVKGSIKDFNLLKKRLLSEQLTKDELDAINNVSNLLESL